MSMNIIDRRKNPKAKSLDNRRRFLERVKESVKDSAKKSIGQRSIKDEGPTNVRVKGGSKEEKFSHDPATGSQDYVVSGNESYQVGDKIQKPRGGGGGRGQQGGRGEGGEDEFEFAISYEEYLDVIFDGLELPNLKKTSEKNSVKFESQRAGYTNSGVPANLNVIKTMTQGLSRRIALRNPKYSEIEELEQEYETATDERKDEIRVQIEELRRSAAAISFLDNNDVRYNNRILVKKPVTQAVMVCVMDVSFSMSAEHKIMAKKFFLLLNRFLRRQYKNVDVVFIRHHETAMECDEVTFFTSRDTGGTVVSPAYKLSREILEKRYPATDWNIYLAQASDGDNSSEDSKDSTAEIERILDIVQFMVYMEVRPSTGWYSSDHVTELEEIIKPLVQTYPERLFMDKIKSESEIVPIFRKIFEKRGIE